MCLKKFFTSASAHLSLTIHGQACSVSNTYHKWGRCRLQLYGIRLITNNWTIKQQCSLPCRAFSHCWTPAFRKHQKSNEIFLVTGTIPKANHVKSTRKSNWKKNSSSQNFPACQHLLVSSFIRYMKWNAKRILCQTSCWALQWILVNRPQLTPSSNLTKTIHSLSYLFRTLLDRAHLSTRYREREHSTFVSANIFEIFRTFFCFLYYICTAGMLWNKILSFHWQSKKKSTIFSTVFSTVTALPSSLAPPLHQSCYVWQWLHIERGDLM